MQVKILGSAAGGGFPQWNCACSNCARLRAGTFHGSTRTQAQLAIRESGNPWCLINASPDLRSQILSDPDLAPQSAPRHSPIAAVVLTGADVDQVIGLLHLREFHPFHIYLTPAVELLLRAENSLFNKLIRKPNGKPSRPGPRRKLSRPMAPIWTWPSRPQQSRRNSPAIPSA